MTDLRRTSTTCLAAKLATIFAILIEQRVAALMIAAIPAGVG